MCHRGGSMSTFDSGIWRLVLQERYQEKCEKITHANANYQLNKPLTSKQLRDA